MKKITTIDYTSILMFAKEWVRKQYRPFSANELRKSYYDAGIKNLKTRMFMEWYSGHYLKII